jgi:excisionase family DNA binding protein
MHPPHERSDSVFVTEPDTQAIKQLETMLEKAYPKLVGVDGQELSLPASVYQLLRQAIHLMAEGKAISLVSHDHYLSSQEAADVLNVSRPHLYTLLDHGQIAYIKVGTHRRILFEDVMEYKRQRDSQRRQALAGLTTLSQDFGFYTADESAASCDI